MLLSESSSSSSSSRLLSVVCMIPDQENLRNFTQKCIIEYFLICWKIFSARARAFTFHRKVGLKCAQVCGSRRRWGSCGHKQVGITPQKWTLLGTQEKLVKQV